MGEGPTDAELVERARSGNRAATEALFRRHFPTATRFAARIAPRQDAEDLAQDALVQALTNLDKLAEPAAFPRWLRGIIVRLLSQRLRRFAILRRLGFGTSLDEFDFDTVIAPAAPVEVRAEIHDLYRHLEALPVDQRMALSLSRIEGLTNEEVAEAMQVSLATVKRKLAAALETLEKASTR